MTRWPRRPQPRKRAMAVVAWLSSTNTSAFTGVSPISTGHLFRCAWTSGRSRSAAWVVFFPREIHGRQTLPDGRLGNMDLELSREPLLHLLQRQVVFFLQPGFQGAKNRIGKLAPRLSGAFPGLQRSGGLELQVVGYRFVAYAEATGDGKVGFAIVDSGDNPVPQIEREGTRHEKPFLRLMPPPTISV